MPRTTYESRRTIHRETYNETEDGCCEIYFRIPFTMYFVGKEIYRDSPKKSKLYLYRKEWDGGGYYFAKV
jgi:hypothetical protein